MLNELDNLFVTDSAAGNVVVIDDVDVVGIQLSKVVEGFAVEVAAEANHPLEVRPDGLEGHWQAPVFHINPEEPAAGEVHLK